MKKIIKILEKEGLPIFWQFHAAFIVCIAFFITLTNNKDVLLFLFLITPLLGLTGIYAGYLSHKQRNFPRILLTSGISIVIVATAIESLFYFNTATHSNIALLLEQFGITLISIFAYIHMLMFEKKFNIKGFTIDYSLLVISSLFFTLLISPETLNILLYELSFYQQSLALNIFVGAALLSMSIIHYLLTKSIGLTDKIRIILTLILVIHFGLEMLLTFNHANDISLTHRFSLGVYYTAGALAIPFIFIEKLSLNYSDIAPSRIGSRFMWVSSIIATVAIPTGLIIRSTLNAPHLDISIIGISSIFLSIIVIWRFIILTSNSNEQKNRLKSLIQTNQISGLPNYLGYLEKLTLIQIKKVLVLHINIDDFKAINDLYGRDSGDEVLKSLAKRIQQLPDSIFIAHTHADVFLAVFKTKESDIQKLLTNIQNNLGVWDIIQGDKIAVPLTYGASYSNDIANPERLAKQAEQALKDAREQHTSFSLFIEETNNNGLPRHELRQILQQAVESDYLPIHFQPIYNLDDGSLKALELLIRVDTEKYGLLLPGRFIDQAKSYGLLTQLTQVCIRMVAKHHASLPDVDININLPPYMLKSPKLLNNFIQLFEENSLPPKKFCIEITEDEDISAHELIPAVQKLKDYGFSIAMDDFGTGYSSLDRLSILAVDTVKIDRSVLLTASSGNTAILEWAISLAKRLGISAVVEGVETEEQLSLIKLLGADSVQGFLYSRPVSALQAYHTPLNSSDISIA